MDVVYMHRSTNIAAQNPCTRDLSADFEVIDRYYSEAIHNLRVRHYDEENQLHAYAVNCLYRLYRERRCPLSIVAWLQFAQNDKNTRAMLQQHRHEEAALRFEFEAVRDFAKLGRANAILMLPGSEYSSWVAKWWAAEKEWKDF